MGLLTWLKARRDGYLEMRAGIAHEWTRPLTQEERETADRQTRTVVYVMKTGTEKAFEFAGWLLILSVFKFGYAHAPGASAWALWGLYWVLLLMAASYVGNLWPLQGMPETRQGTIRGRGWRLFWSAAAVWGTFAVSNWISEMLGAIQFK